MLIFPCSWLESLGCTFYYSIELVFRLAFFMNLIRESMMSAFPNWLSVNASGDDRDRPSWAKLCTSCHKRFEKLAKHPSALRRTLKLSALFTTKLVSKASFHNNNFVLSERLLLFRWFNNISSSFTPFSNNHIQTFPVRKSKAPYKNILRILLCDAN